MVSSWGFNFRNIRKALIHSLQLAQKLNGSPHGKSPPPVVLCSEVCRRLNANQSPHKTCMQPTGFLENLSGPQSWRNLPPQGKQVLEVLWWSTKKKLIPSLVFQKVSIRDLVLVPWPKARLKDTSLILIICTHQSTLIIWSFCENSIVRATS